MFSLVKTNAHQIFYAKTIARVQGCFTIGWNNGNMAGQNLVLDQQRSIHTSFYCLAFRTSSENGWTSSENGCLVLFWSWWSPCWRFMKPSVCVYPDCCWPDIIVAVFLCLRWSRELFSFTAHTGCVFQHNFTVHRALLNIRSRASLKLLPALAVVTTYIYYFTFTHNIHILKESMQGYIKIT